MNGLLLAIQFFTSVPIRKELPLGRNEVTAMYVALPFVGAAIGFAMFALSMLMQNVLSTGPLLTAVFIVLTSIVLTGGLHLDGWADTADAFFSYKDQKRRLEILEDPRLGAFGTMALILLVMVKVALFHELLERGAMSIALFIAIPLLARTGMNIYFSMTRTAKDQGLAHFFKEKLDGGSVVGWSLGVGIATLIGLGYVMGSFIMPSLLFAILIIVFLIFRGWSCKHFGGVTGDLAGAFIEGMEVALWIVVLVLL